MAFQINTNVNALNAHANSVFVQRKLSGALEKLSSGLRINKAADDASGMVIADSLRSQARSLGQAIMNANDGIGIIQIADKAMDEQIKILDTIKVKATQAAEDGQNSDSRRAIQSDINRLIEGLDYIGNTTTYNGMSLLSGAFADKKFQVGAYSNQTINATIGATTSDKIGQIRVETGSMITAASVAAITFKNVDGSNNVQLESVKISSSAGTGLGVLAQAINKNANKTGIRAVANVITTSNTAVKSGAINGLKINGVSIGDIVGIKKNDSDGRLVAAINAVTAQTGVEANTDTRGRLNLISRDGRGIDIYATRPANQNQGAQGGQAGAAGMAITGVNGNQSITGSQNYGRLTLTRLDARDIIVVNTDKLKQATNGGAQGQPGGNQAAIEAVRTYSAIGFGATVAETTVNLRDVTGTFNSRVTSASGANVNAVIAGDGKELGSGVTSLKGAMMVMDIAQSAQQSLDKIRANLGSVQNQMTSTLNNITVTQVNVKSAESQIRDVDFAEESATFSKYNILAQSGSYAMSQANAVQQNILRLLS